VLHLIAKNGYKEAVQLLIDNRANVDAKDKGGWTALYLAAKNRHKAVVHLLVKKGANVDAKDDRG
jgi:ankyrin repeat protein